MHNENSRSYGKVGIIGIELKNLINDILKTKGKCLIEKGSTGDFPGGPVVKSPYFQCRGCGFYLCVCVCVCVCARARSVTQLCPALFDPLSCVWLFAIPWTVAYQAPTSMGFSRPEYWSGLPFPSPEDLPDPGIKPGSPTL